MLSAIYIKGFKTFARPARLPLEGGVTVIVGPNGSGKSNITDAVLFACGEQRPGVLRASGMGDLVFSGSEEISASGVAEVTLVFDNSEGEISLPYEEVSVTRRNSRDGGSEYLINGARSRLSDVRSVAEEAGVGSHSVLRQGAVDSIVSGGAAACRNALEEAAGLGVYRRRRRETGRRLERAEEQLQSIRQLEAELGDQLQRIEREAEAAREYRRLESRFRELSLAHLYDVATRDTGELDRELSRNREALSELVRERESLSRRETEIEEKTESLEAEEQRLETAVEGMERLVEGLRSESARGERVAFRAEQHLQGLREQSERADQIKEELEKSRRSVATLEERVEATEQERGHRKEEFEAADEEVSGLRSRHAAVESRVGELSRALGELEKRRDDARSVVEEAPAVDPEPLSRIASELEEFSPLEPGGRLDALRREVRQSRSRADELSAGLEKRWGSLSALLGRTEAEVRELEDTKRSAGKRLYEIVRPLPGFERAVEAALGELFGGVLAGDLDEALGLLSSEERVAVRLDAGEMDEEELPSGTPLLDCVEVLEPGYEGALRRLLSGIYLVERPAGNHLSNGHVAVTREGLRLTRTSARRLAGGGEIEREVLLERAQERLEHLKEGPEKRLQGFRDELSGVYYRLDGLIRFLEGAGAVSSRLSTVSRRVSDLATHRLGKLQRRSERAAARRRELENLDRELTTARESLRESREEHEKLGARLSEASPTLDAARERFREAEAASSRTAAEVEAARSQERRLREELERTDRVSPEEAAGIANSARGSVNLSQKLVEAARGRLETLRAQKRELSPRRKSLSQERNDISRRSSEVAAGIASAEAGISRLEDEISRTRRAAEKAENELFEEWGATLDDAREYAEDDPDPDGRERQRLARELKGFGDVNLLSISQEKEIRARHDFTRDQREDAEAAAAELEHIVQETDREVERRFGEMFGRVRDAFSEVVPRMMEGSSGRLELTEEGVEIGVRLGRKGWRPLRVLSGGERSLLALSFLFSILLSRLEGSSKRVFCLLDEAEAALDDVNLARFLAMIDSYRMGGQFLLMTHQKRTMASADILYGVAQDATGASNVVSKRLSGE